MGGNLKFETFKGLVSLSMEDLCRELFLDNKENIKIKKEGVAVKNLVKILDAALTLSNEKGFAAMSLRDLSAKAGLSMGALYTYFSSKEELLQMIQRQSAVVVHVLLDQIEGIEDPLSKLKRVIQSHLFLSEVMQPWFYFAYMETKNLAKQEHKKSIEAELATEKLLIDIMKEGRDKGVFKSIDMELTGAVIKAMLQDWYLKRWKYARRNVSVEKYAAFVVDIIETYIEIPQQQ